MSVPGSERPCLLKTGWCHFLRRVVAELDEVVQFLRKYPRTVSHLTPAAFALTACASMMAQVWEALGFSEDDVRQIENDTVIVHVEADYLGPAAFYDLLRISIATAQLGRSSLHLEYRVINERNDQEIFTARMVMVQVDLATETSRPWSTAFREAIIQYHGRQVMQS